MSQDKNDDEKLLDKYEKYLIPAYIYDTSSLIRKYGADIHDDFVFWVLTTSLIQRQENEWMSGEYDVELRQIMDEEDRLERQYNLKNVESYPSAEIQEKMESLERKGSNLRLIHCSA